VLDGFHACGLSAFAVPDSVEEIRLHCFWSCDLLREITFGAESKLKRMNGPLFCGIERFEVPDSVEVIGDSVFGGCPNLTDLIFGVNSHVREIGYEFCTTQEEDYLWGANIRSVTIPASVEVIKRDAFSSCFLLERLEFAPCSRLKELNGFRDTGMWELDSPDSVEVIGPGTFRPCRHLRIVRFGVDSRLRSVKARLKHAIMRYTERYLKIARCEFEFVEDPTFPQENVAIWPELGSSDDEFYAKLANDRMAKRTKSGELDQDE
jgi:hypothetical protein